ncbi:enoyl-CoA hydratase/isomerase family protein [Sphingomonas sp. CGMCC 1.13654]|uniref:Enoyl-CoA hydratase/isomerase family protein n=1 Tax=Sphingomonas chungangi TaxID=2683589 RepID=A0A838L5M2_9SPHN|nr:enoyl-CoA hydratase-related protein [Sphingomonas chungangi]MBA2933759.1 enoyl-CoA hydratase/isomerase family protein [Sphingomonas chungangi]MVW55090.1 2-(1,2-epoxy-1,2-dihydrophenyl)acetyl-CoA isomerase [Sphingomonas chungangi]
MPYAKLTYEVTDNVASIRLNDPARLNAIGPAMGRELLDAIGRASREARAIVLSGEGRAFCSGADLGDEWLDMADPVRDAGAYLDGVFNPIVHAMRDAPVPMITAVRGAAAGVGCGIALAGDLILASETGYFYQAFSRVGLSPDGGSSYLLTRAIGRPRAMELMLLGDRLPAAKAFDWGLINRVVADDALDGEAMAMAHDLANGPASIAVIKRVAWAALDSSFETALSNERAGQRDAGRTEDFAEGIRAFQERRPPRFTGR